MKAAVHFVFIALTLGTASRGFAQDASPVPSSAPGAAVGAAATAASTDESGEELAKKLNNPISDLVSVPFQFNWENGIGSPDRTRFILNIQPVMPFALNDKLNLIARIVAPIVSQPPSIAGGIGTSGVSDPLVSFFLSPSKGSFTWGVGPAISLPSTNDPTLGSQKWAAGPTVVALKQMSGLTVGALMNQIWSFAGAPDRPSVNQMFLQPFVAYTTKSLWTFSASYLFGWGYFFAQPGTFGATWKVRAAITILLPKKK